MDSFVTSYVGLFGLPNEREQAGIERIEIPLVQRDYAQGRDSAEVAEIRADFLDVLCTAVSGSGSVGLDFVYGDVQKGVLRPLDGQQRLTTLFLLHWYLAFRTERLSSELPWTQFRYATRPSAELFCERITANPPPADVDGPSDWIRDQCWFHYQWRHDPTIQAMLVMIDALDEHLRNGEMESAWAHLTSEIDPAISFHVLAIDEVGAGDELYIKMNSRGKPLTAFENFKARFEKALEGSDRATEFADGVDGPWSDVLWRYRGDDNIVDDEFIRYFSFVTEVTEWHNGIVASGRLETRAERLFGTGSAAHSDNLDFLFHAFDAWVDIDIETFFSHLLTNDQAKDGSKVLFFGGQGTNHFHECCATYAFSRQRRFGWAQTLTLYATLLHRIHETVDFPRRLRVLRNLVEASANELRIENMPNLVRAVERLVLGDTLREALKAVSAFNEAQIDDEREKAELLESHPELSDAVFKLEDHPLLRGSLVAFELDPERLRDRASTFADVMDDPTVWPTLTGAMLATGDYSRHLNPRSSRFGSPSDGRWWRELLTGTKRSNLRGTAQVLAEVLDTVANSDQAIEVALESIRADWLAAQDSYGWREYLVKYKAMREGKSGIYFGVGGQMGFQLCMLDKKQLNSWYQDPYLLALWQESGVLDAARVPWFTGYETNPRRMMLTQSGVQIQCVDDGFLVQPPTESRYTALFEGVCADFGITEDQKLIITQMPVDGETKDTEDRVQAAATLLKALVKAGL